MKKFLCYDTNDAASGKIDVDSRGMLKSTGSSAQADWNVTDSNDPAFIKNKPFGNVPGVEVFSGYSPRIETDDDGNQVFTFTGAVGQIDSGNLVNIQFDTGTYENITADQTYTSSTSWEYTFDTAGLPFTVKIEGSYEMSSTVKVTTLDGSYISYIKIVDMSRNSEVKIDKKYLPDAVQVQSNWKVTDSSSPAFILNKPEIPNGVTWFSASGTKDNMVIKKGKDWNNGTTVYGQGLLDAFEKGVCRCKVTITSNSTTYESIGTITGCREFIACSYHRIGAAITCYSNTTNGENATPMIVEASVVKK